MFKEEITEWTDSDIAAYKLAVSLGLMNPDVDSYTTAKHVFWSKNEIGTVLYNILGALADKGVLEVDTENEKVRWNQSFRGSWEK